MKKLVYPICLLAVMFTGMVACKKSSNEQSKNGQLSEEEKSLIASAGFNKDWAEKRANGSYLIEGDILLTQAQLNEMAGATPSNNFIVANEEHYRTFNVVSTPSSGSRVITLSLSSGFPANYSTALDNVIARYNSYNLKITFQRVASGGEINITAANLGTTSTGGCILGQAAGFPTSSGNPSAGFILSNSSCATSSLNTVDRVDEVIAHEIGHCIGFRHTDYKNRASCGGGGESAGTIGAVHIPGTPRNVSGSYNSWMMACINGSPSFSSADITALNYVY